MLRLLWRINYGYPRDTDVIAALLKTRTVAFYPPDPVIAQLTPVSAPIMTHHTQSSTRAKVDVINFWCVAILIVSAASVAGVVGAAVVAGEFEERNFNVNSSENATEVGVLIETQADGTTRVRWSERGAAQFLEIRVDGEVVNRLNFIGDEFIVEGGAFEVYAIYETRPPTLIESRG